MTVSTYERQAYPSSRGSGSAAVLVSPQIASIGPSLHLGSPDLWVPERSKSVAFGAYRMLQVLCTLALGMIILLVPMSLIAYAADQLNVAQDVNRTQFEVERPRAVPEAPGGLAPAWTGPVAQSAR